MARWDKVALRHSHGSHCGRAWREEMRAGASGEPAARAMPCHTPRVALLTEPSLDPFAIGGPRAEPSREDARMQEIDRMLHHKTSQFLELGFTCTVPVWPGLYRYNPEAGAPDAV